MRGNGNKSTDCLFYQMSSGYNKSRNMCLPQNCIYQQKFSSDFQMKFLFLNILHRDNIKDLIAKDRFHLYSDKYILTHVLVYMKRLDLSSPTDLDFLSLLGLAVDMLEDFSLDIFCIMLKTFAYIQCTKLDARYIAGSGFLTYENSFISGIRKVSVRKLAILKELNFNAYIDKESKEYLQCEGIVDSILRGNHFGNNCLARTPLPLRKQNGIYRHMDLIERHTKELMDIERHLKEMQMVTYSTLVHDGYPDCSSHLPVDTSHHLDTSHHRDPWYFSVEQDGVNSCHPGNQSSTSWRIPHKLVY